MGLITSGKFIGAGTSSAIDTTGADLIIIVVGCDGNTHFTADSKSNSYSELTGTGGASAHMKIYYKLNPTVGSGHTFTTSLAYGSICYAAFSGAHDTSSYDVENGASAGSGTGISTGSVTPSVDGSLLLTGLCLGGAEASGWTIDNGFTKVQQNDAVSGTNYGSAIAYLVQGSAAAINPAWSWTSSVGNAVRIATFKPDGTGFGEGGASAVPVLMQQYQMQGNNYGRSNRR